MASTVEFLLKLRDEATGALKSATGAADDAAKSGDKAAVSWAAVGAGLAAAGAAAAATAAAWAKLNQMVADSVNDLNDMATRTGVAAQTLQGLELAAEGSGTTLGALEGSLRRMVQSMSDARAGTGEAVEAFAALGITTDQLVGPGGQLLSADEGLRLIAASLQGVEDPTAKAALAMDVFGRSAGAMLQSGALDNLENFTQAAEVFGVDVGPRASASAAAWQRSMANLGMVLKAFPQQLNDALGVDSVEVLNVFTTAVSFVGTLVTEVVAQVVRNVGHLGAVLEGVFSFGLTGKVDAFKVAMDAANENVDTLAGLFDKAADAAQQTADEVERLGRATSATGRTGGGGGGGFKLPPATEAAVDKAATAATEKASQALDAVGQAAQDSAAAFADDWSQLMLALDQAVVELESISTMDMRVANASRAVMEVGPAATSAVTGDVTGAITGGMTLAGGSAAAAAGPVGMVLSALTSIGSMGGADGVEDAMAEWGQNLLDGIEALPEIVGKVIPEFIVGMVESLPAVIIEAIPALIGAQGKAFRKLFVELPFYFAKGVWDGLTAWWDKVRSWVENLFSLAKDGGVVDQTKSWLNDVTGGRVFEQGGFVDRTGLAMVHAGEQVVPAGSTANAAQASRMGVGGGVTVQVNTAVLDPDTIPALVRLINEQLGDYGRGLAVAGAS